MSLLDFVFEPTVETKVVTVKQQFIEDVSFNGITNSFSQYPKIDMFPYANPSNAYEFTTKKYTDDMFLTITTASSTYQPILSNASYLDATSSVQTQLNGKTSEAYVDTQISGLSSVYQPILSNASFLDATSSVQTQLNGKTNESYVDTQISGLSSVYQPILSNASFLDATSSVQTQLNGKTTESYVNTQINNLINSAPGTMDTLGEISNILSTNVNDIGTLTTSIAGKVSKTANETVSGILTFSQPPVMSGASISSGTIPDSSLVSTFLKTSDASTTYLSQTDATTALNLKANLVSPALTGTPTAPTPNVINNTTQIATTAYVKSNLSSYQTTLNGSSNITVGTLACSTLTPSALITSTIFTENLVSVTPSGNVYTLDFAFGNVFYSNGNPSANFTCNITNIPTSSNSQQFTITLITNIGTYYCSSASAVKTNLAGIVSAAAPKYPDGIAPTVGTASIVIHTLTVIQCFATKYIIYGASPFN